MVMVILIAITIIRETIYIYIYIDVHVHTYSYLLIVRSSNLLVLVGWQASLGHLPGRGHFTKEIYAQHCGCGEAAVGSEVLEALSFCDFRVDDDDDDG